MTLISSSTGGLTRPATALPPSDGAAGRRVPVDVRAPDRTGKVLPARFPCFDGLRAIAALSVLGIHTAFDSGFTSSDHTFGSYTARLEFGVEVFFVVSGFLLYRPFVAAAMNGTAAPDRWKFWVRRLKRIVPGYWAALLLVTYVLHADSLGPAWYDPLVYLGFGQIYVPSLSLGGLSQAWTLDIEMTFYLVLPLYAALMGSRWLTRRGQGADCRTAEDGPGPGRAAIRSPGRQLRLELIGLGALTAISFAWRITILLAQEQPHARNLVVQAGTTWLPAYLDQFALGMLLAVLSAYFTATGRTPPMLTSRALPKVSWGIAFVAFVAAAHIGLSRLPIATNSVPLMLGRQGLYGVIAVFLVLPAVFGPQDRGWIRTFLRWRPVVAIGVVSYGFYLWHQAWGAMFFRWTGAHILDVAWPELAAFVLALSVVSGTVSYLLVERPVVRHRPRTGRTGRHGAPVLRREPTEGALA
jgi:peptidoglycan/LPS O-acetylase OafA/YrhL